MATCMDTRPVIQMTSRGGLSIGSEESTLQASPAHWPAITCTPTPS
ncbi:hypothetical protein ACFFX0_31645 [Citricoccus parietis]|uniref:Uncharacterized protein n=1 Tax=Citricoccus parietis TaxID=592307 RepID=A0ABV5G957_9MICC